MAQAESYTGVDNLEVMQDAENYNSWLLKRIARVLNPGSPVLDFGAGTGFFTDRLKARGFNIVCVEPDRVLQGMLGRKGLKVASSIRDLGGQVFRSVYSLNVLEHIEDDQAILRELSSVIVPGGKLYLYVPAFQVLFSSMDSKVGHFRRYRISDLREKLEASGFAVQGQTYLDFMGFWATLAFKLIGNSNGDLNPLAVKVFDRLIFPLNYFFDAVFGAFVGKNLEIVAVRRAP